MSASFIKKNAKSSAGILLTNIILCAALAATQTTSFAKETLTPQASYLLDSPHTLIDLNTFVPAEKATYKGRIAIVPPKNFRFLGTLKALPEKKPTGYLYTALKIMQVNPLPKVEYQAFLGLPGSPEKPGSVITVYLDNNLAQALTARSKKEYINQSLMWYGYHIYNFSRGPALVLEDVEILKNGKSNNLPEELQTQTSQTEGSQPRSQAHAEVTR